MWFFVCDFDASLDSYIDTDHDIVLLQTFGTHVM